MMKSLYKHFLALHAVPFPLLCVCMGISAALILAFLAFNWTLWLVGLLVLAAWVPVILYQMRDISRRHGWLALLFLLLASQTAHFFEHMSQLVEIHLLGLTGNRAAGIISVLNTEWVHFLWNSWVLLIAIALMFFFRKNPFLWLLFIFSIYHEIEHSYILSVYLHTGIQGTPGLLASGGLIGGGLPISRPDLHGLYAVYEEALLLVAYYVEFSRVTIPAIRHQPQLTHASSRSTPVRANRSAFGS